jgi:molecular chaperone GrpE
MMDRSLNGKKKKDPGETDQVRVTDRRRIHLEQNQNQHSDNTAEGPSLKPTYVEELEARTKAAEKLVDEVQGRFNQLRQQLQKETDETRQRLNRAADERAQREKADFIASLLPVGDNLARAIQAAESGSSVETIAAGIRSTASAFESALAAAGVEAIQSVGQAFDPQLHEAVDTVEVERGMDGKVITEYSRGFKMGDRLLRPAQVQVGRALGEIGEAYDSQSSKG